MFRTNTFGAVAFMLLNIARNPLLMSVLVSILLIFSTFVYLIGFYQTVLYFSVIGVVLFITFMKYLKSKVNAESN
jgi:hypothetical protein